MYDPPSARGSPLPIRPQRSEDVTFIIPQKCIKVKQIKGFYRELPKNAAKIPDIRNFFEKID